MSEIMLDVLGVIPFEIVFTYALTKVLPMRNVTLFWVVRMTLEVALACTRAILPSSVRVAMGLVGSVLIPLVMSKGPFRRRVLVTLLSNIVLFCAELLGLALWVAITGLEVADYAAARANLSAHFFVHAVHLLVVAGLMAVLKMTLDRISTQRTDKGTKFFAGFLVTQVALIAVALIIQMTLLNGMPSLFYGAAALALCCLVVDAFALMSMNRYGSKQLDEDYARVLQARLDDSLREYNYVAAEIEQTARIRHDMRNQLQVVASLAEDGDVVRARQQVATMLQSLESTAGRGVPAKAAASVDGGAQ